MRLFVTYYTEYRNTQVLRVNALLLYRFAYVEFADKDSAKTALALDESLFKGRQLKVCYTKSYTHMNYMHILYRTNLPSRFCDGTL